MYVLVGHRAGDVFVVVGHRVIFFCRFGNLPVQGRSCQNILFSLIGFFQEGSRWRIAGGARLGTAR